MRQDRHMTSTTATTARTTYTVGTTKTGTKIHKASVNEKGGVFSACGTGNSISMLRGRIGWITSTTEIETGTTPVGALCSKCFVGVTEIAAPVAAAEPTPAARPAVVFVTFAEIAEMAAAAGCADQLPEGFAARTNAYGQPEKMSAADAAEFVASIA